MNIMKTLLATTVIIGISASMALAGGLGHKKDGTPPPRQEQGQNGGQRADGTPPPPPPIQQNANGAGAGNNPQNTNQPNGGGFVRPVELIGPELGVTGTQFATCFEAVNPAPQGTEPTIEREQANKAVLLPCLQAINPSITNDLLDSVTGKYRPN